MNTLNNTQGKALMVCGTTSNAGKSTLVTGLCRLLANKGVSVAPFKAQNMSLNSAMTHQGHEIGRAQYLQAIAAQIEPSVQMNPILLKPTDNKTSQVILMGEPIGEMTAQEYQKFKPKLFELVNESLYSLRENHEIVLLEGAGSPAEINLLPNDLVNLRLAKSADISAILVGDINLGGVFASLYGTVKILPEDLQGIIKGFIINKLRGDPSLLKKGTDQLEELTEIPTLGVVPMLEDLALEGEDSENFGNSNFSSAVPITQIKKFNNSDDEDPIAVNRFSNFETETIVDDDEEDSNVVEIEFQDNTKSTSLEIAVIKFPFLSNFTDLDPLQMELDVSIRFISSPKELTSADLIILPGSKQTVKDLQWMQEVGLFEKISAFANNGASIFGICAGYQMMGRSIIDDVESKLGEIDAMGLLPVTTLFEPKKVLRQISGVALKEPISGYQIHHGKVRAGHPATNWITFDDGSLEGCHIGSVYGTSVHGIFESDEFRRSFLLTVAENARKTFTATDIGFDELREQQLNRLSRHLESNLDLNMFDQLLKTNS